MNKIILTGNLGADPDYKTFGEGRKVASFSLAQTKRFQKQGEWKSHTNWHYCCAFDDRAEYIAKKLFRGAKALIEGEIYYREYETKEGVKKQRTEIIVSHFELLEKRKQKKADPLQGIEPNDINEKGKTPSEISAERLAKQKTEAATMEDDLPF